MKKPKIGDKIYVGSTLHHLFDPQKGLAEMVRVLKPGGRIAIMEPNYLFPKNFLLAHTNPAERNIRQITKGNLETWLSELNLKTYNVRNFSFIPPTLLTLSGIFVSLDNNLKKIPIVKEFSVMLFAYGTK